MTALKLICTLCTLLTYQYAQAQNGIIQLGGQSAGMAYSTTALEGSWAIFNNPAGIAALPATCVLATVENKYAISSLNTVAFGGITQFFSGNLGITALRFGDHLYNENMLSLAYANSFGIGSLGLRVNYLQYNIEGYGRQATMSIDFGGTTKLSDLITVGAVIRNVNQAKINDKQQPVPILLNAGICIFPSDKVIVGLEVEKDIDYRPTVKLGLQYVLIEKLSVRAGVNTHPFYQTAGLGFKSDPLTIDYALRHDAFLGFSNQLSLLLNLKKK